MNGDIDAEIQKKEAELAPIRQCMEELKAQFITQTVAFAAEWYKNTAKQYVTKYPEVTLRMRAEKNRPDESPSQPANPRRRKNRSG